MSGISSIYYIAMMLLFVYISFALSIKYQNNELNIFDYKALCVMSYDIYFLLACSDFCSSIFI